MYRTIKSEQDFILLQRDLDTLSQWVKAWQMRFNLSKCTVMRCTRSLNPIILNYSFHGSTLSVTHKHIRTLKVCWMITFHGLSPMLLIRLLKRHLSKCSSKIKVSAYLQMVHPFVEYAYVVWELCMHGHTM